MTRILFFLIVAAGIYLVIRTKLWNKAQRPANPEVGERLVRCSQCGTWIPEHSAPEITPTKPLCNHCRDGQPD